MSRGHRLLLEPTDHPPPHVPETGEVKAQLGVNAAPPLGCAKLQQQREEKAQLIPKSREK